VISDRAVLIISYALSGFAHLASVGIFVGGTIALIPSRRKDISELGWKALFVGTLATMMIGAVAGVFYQEGNTSILGDQPPAQIAPAVTPGASPTASPTSPATTVAPSSPSLTTPAPTTAPATTSPTASPTTSPAATTSPVPSSPTATPRAQAAPKTAPNATAVPSGTPASRATPSASPRP
jgi:CNT family concentrative nucleoside transporter